VRAQAVGLSEQGAGIVCDRPVEARSMVYLQAPAYGLIGSASVRYCGRSGLKYRRGLLFSASPALADARNVRTTDIGLTTKRTWCVSIRSWR